MMETAFEQTAALFNQLTRGEKARLLQWAARDLSDAYAGIVVCTYDPDFIALAARIDTAVQTQPGLRRQLLRINRNL
jgi:hypothetical protein